VILHLALPAVKGQAVAAAVEVAVEALLHAVAFQQVDDLLAAVALVEGRIMEKTQLFPLPCRLQGCLQPDQLPVEDLGILPLLVQLIKPAPGAAEGHVAVKAAVVVQQFQGGKTVFLERKEPHDLAEKIISDLEVVTPGTETPVRRLSGGNVQKVLVGREIAAAPTVLMAAYPVRGLDINSSYLIYNLLNEQKERGVAVVFVGEDLDVLLELCDRILVIGSGRVTGIVDARTATKEEIGLLMTKGKGEEK